MKQWEKSCGTEYMVLGIERWSGDAAVAPHVARAEALSRNKFND
ncbi:hypothetical protein ABLG96_02710 [Nakamurella sp. A5-74]|uniref:Uncharacterized protein n=1 Tax=Nakamurella sp. A5-74 TaxID=3158264 RepID=A0AAU8DSK7_9ACTN